MLENKLLQNNIGDEFPRQNDDNKNEFLEQDNISSIFNIPIQQYDNNVEIMAEDQPMTNLNKITEEDEYKTSNYLEQNSNENNFQMIKQIPDTGIDENCEEYTRVYTYEDEKKETVYVVDFFYKCGSLNNKSIFNKFSFDFFSEFDLDFSKCTTKEEIINEINNKKTEPELNFYFDLCTLEQANTRNYILHLKTTNLEEDSKNYFPKLKNHFLQAFIMIIRINPCFIETNEDIDYWINVFTKLNKKINDIRQVAEDDLTNQMVKKIEEIVALLKNAKNDITNKRSTKQKNISKIQDDYNLQINYKLQDILELMAIELINNNSICGCNLCGCVPCCRYFRDS